MFCYRCESNAGHLEVCPVCGANLFYVQKARKLSNAYYNEALEKASVRNLSGAIVCLKTSLKFNKYNIDARNLLGLCYLEVGETVDAISEWVISKNFQPDGNRAEFYLDDIQANPSHLDSVNQTIKKYNQALLYCKQDSRDLAIIQLKKVIGLNAHLVKAHQLLGLLYLQEGKLDAAKKTLRNAAKVDTDNTTTLRYLKEVNQRIKDDHPKKKSLGDDLISYQSGNETIIMPKHFKESSIGATIVAVIAGLVIGCLATAFLLVPGVKQKAQAEAKEEVLSANDSISQNKQMIEVLNNQIADLQDQLEQKDEDNERNASKSEASDNLLLAYVAVGEEDYITAGNYLNSIQQDLLSETALRIYNQLNEQVREKYIEELYTEGYDCFVAGDNDKAIADLETVVESDKDYNEGQAVYYLAQAYRKRGNSELGDLEKAKEYYQYVIDTYPGTEKARTAERYLDQL